MGIPKTPIMLMNKVYMDVFPAVQKELEFWKREARQIPDPELRKQALDSIEAKDFHCEGGGIFSLLSESRKEEALSFIVAYQTISDYLDNLCDRSTSLDDKDFAALHESMQHALRKSSPVTNYYRFRDEQDDGGYLAKLVDKCQQIFWKMDNYECIAAYLSELCRYYSDLQIHKHVIQHERVPRLKEWFKTFEKEVPDMSWYEFSACSGSTLGIFCLISYALRPDFREEDAERIYKVYFPYIQGLHILLDYFIDQEEDLVGGDLNFCTYYDSKEQMFERFSHFVKEADACLNELPHEHFHKLIHRGLLGLYLSDEKAAAEPDTKLLAKKLVKLGGSQARFFYKNAKLYRFVKKLLPRRYALSTIE